jgi:TonB family protein
MLKFVQFAAGTAIIAMTLAVSTQAQQSVSTSEAGRKIAIRLAPVYPQLAKNLHLQGTVKVEAVVRPNGTVKSTKVLGGNPVLADAAQQAIVKWKFEPAPEETTEVVQLTFVAQ